MKRIATFTAVLAAGAAAASPAVADDHARDAHARAVDRIDRYGPVEPGTTWGTPAPQPQPGQPTWPTNPHSLPQPAAIAPVDGGGSDDTGWILLGAGLVTAGIVGASAAGVTRRYRVRARRMAV